MKNQSKQIIHLLNSDCQPLFWQATVGRSFNVMMSENELLELGFMPNVDSRGEKISYHPEGVTFKLVNGDFTLSTTDLYPYLWVCYKGGAAELVSRKITKERIIKALQFKSKSDIAFLGDE